MNLEFLVYFIPLFPLLVRGLFTLQLKTHLTEAVGEKELDRENIRNLILVLEGFSFTALLALTLLEPNVKQNLKFPIYFTFLSFIFYMIVRNLQGYKSNRLEEIISDTLFETASLCLILTVICLLFMSGLSQVFIYFISAIGIAGWLIDFLIRLNIQFKDLNERK